MDRTTSAWVTHPWVDEAATRIRFGIVHPLLGVDLAWPDLLQRVRQAEALGFDSYWFSDHPLLNPDCWTRIRRPRRHDADDPVSARWSAASTIATRPCSPASSPISIA